MEIDQIVVYKDSARMLSGGCGLVAAVDEENPDWIWIRWLGSEDIRKERVEELKAIPQCCKRRRASASRRV